MDRSTLAIHAGRGARLSGAPLNAPLVPASSFHGGAYAREDGAPGWEAFEEAIGVLEGVCAAVRVFTHAKSLGGVESLIDRRGPSLLRLSVGCEHVEDLWNDLASVLKH